MAEKISGKEPLAERTLQFFRKLGWVGMGAAGVVAVAVPALAVPAAAYMAGNLAENEVSKRAEMSLKKSRSKKS